MRRIVFISAIIAVFLFSVLGAGRTSKSLTLLDDMHDHFFYGTLRDCVAQLPGQTQDKSLECAFKKTVECRSRFDGGDGCSPPGEPPLDPFFTNTDGSCENLLAAASGEKAKLYADLNMQRDDFGDASGRQYKYNLQESIAKFLDTHKIANRKQLNKYPELKAYLEDFACYHAARRVFRMIGKGSGGNDNRCIYPDENRTDYYFAVHAYVTPSGDLGKFSQGIRPFVDETKTDRKGPAALACDRVCMSVNDVPNDADMSFSCKSPAEWDAIVGALSKDLELPDSYTRGCGYLTKEFCGGGIYDPYHYTRASEKRELIYNELPNMDLGRFSTPEIHEMHYKVVKNYLVHDLNIAIQDMYLESYLQTAALVSTSSEMIEFNEAVEKLKTDVGKCKRYPEDKSALERIDEMRATVPLDSTLPVDRNGKAPESKNDVAQAKYRKGMALGAQCVGEIKKRWNKLSYELGVDWEKKTIGPIVTNEQLGRKLPNYVSDAAMIVTDIPIVRHFLKEYPWIKGDLAGREDQVCHPARTWLQGAWTGAGPFPDYSFVQDGRRYVNRGALGSPGYCDRTQQEFVELTRQMDQILSTYPSLAEEVISAGRKMPAYRAILRTGGPVDASVRGYHLDQNRHRVKRICRVLQADHSLAPAVDQNGAYITSSDCAAEGYHFNSAGRDLSNDSLFKEDGSFKSCMEKISNKEPSAQMLQATRDIISGKQTKQLEALRKQLKDMFCTNNDTFYAGEMVSNPSLMAQYFDCKRVRFAVLKSLRGEDPFEGTQVVSTDEECKNRINSGWAACTLKNEYRQKQMAKQASAEVKQEFLQATGDLLFFATPFAGRVAPTVGRVGTGMVVGGSVALYLGPSADDVDMMHRSAGFRVAQFYAGYGTINEFLEAKQELTSLAKSNPRTHGLLMGIVFGGLFGAFQEGVSGKVRGIDEFGIPRSADAASAMRVDDVVRLFRGWKESLHKQKLNTDYINARVGEVRSLVDAQIFKKFGIDLKDIDLKDLSVEDRIRILQDPTFGSMPLRDRIAILKNPDLAKRFPEGTPDFIRKRIEAANKPPVVSPGVVAAVETKTVTKKPEAISQMESSLMAKRYTREDIYNSITQQPGSEAAANAYLQHVKRGLASELGEQAVRNLQNPDDILVVSLLDDFLKQMESDQWLPREYLAKIKMARRKMKNVLEGKITSCKSISACMQELGQEVGFEQSHPMVRAVDNHVAWAVEKPIRRSEENIARAERGFLTQYNKRRQKVRFEEYESAYFQTASEYLSTNGVGHKVIYGVDGEMRIVIEPAGKSALNRFAATALRTRGTRIEFRLDAFFDPIEASDGSVIHAPNHRRGGFDMLNNTLYLSQESLRFPDKAPSDFMVGHEIGHVDTASKSRQKISTPFLGDVRAAPGTLLPGPRHKVADGYSSWMGVDEMRQYYKDLSRTVAKEVVPALGSPDFDAVLTTLASRVGTAKAITERAKLTSQGALDTLKSPGAQVKYVADQYGTVSALIEVKMTQGNYTFTVPLTKSKGVFDPMNASYAAAQIETTVTLAREQLPILEEVGRLQKVLAGLEPENASRNVYVKAIRSLLSRRGAYGSRPPVGRPGHVPITDFAKFKKQLRSESEKFIRERGEK